MITQSKGEREYKLVRYFQIPLGVGMTIFQSQDQYMIVYFSLQII